MIVRRFDIHLVRLPLRQPWTSALGTEEAVETVLIHAFSDSAEAWAETCPLGLPTYSPEYAAGVASLTARVFAPRLLGRELEDAGAVGRLLAPFRGNPFARAGLDHAWWALHAAATGRPLHLCLGGDDRPVPMGDGLGIVRDLDRLRDRVGELLAREFRRVKLKIQPGWDAVPVSAVRDAFPDAPLMVDCNGAYQPDDWPVFQELDRHRLLMIEQPFAPPDLHLHASLQARLATPLCLDESIDSVTAARAAIELGACRIFNVKPGRVGGATAAVEICRLAQAHGLPCWIGGMLETGLGASLNLALATLPACTLPTVNLCSDRWFAHDIVAPSLAMTAPGVIIPACRPGVGREVDTGLVERLTLARERVGG